MAVTCERAEPMGVRPGTDPVECRGVPEEWLGANARRRCSILRPITEGIEVGPVAVPFLANAPARI